MLYEIKRDGVTILEHEINGKRTQSSPAVDFVDIEFDYYQTIDFKKNDTLVFKGQTYYCDKQSVNIYKKSTNLYNHKARFLGENYRATEIALLSPDFTTHIFDIEGNLLTLVTLAVANLNRVSSGWSFDEDIPNTITKKFAISDENVMAFLTKVSGEFEIPFYIENKVIKFAEYNHEDGGEFEYGKGNGFLDLRKAYRNGEKVPNSVFASGGNGLQLPDPVSDDDDIDANGVIEGFYHNERIYATTRANVTFGVSPTVFRTDLEFSIYAHQIEGQRPWINFETGALAGLSFYLQSEQYDIVSGEKILTIAKRFVDGVEYPNATARPLAGDRYNVTNINQPQSVVDDALSRLQAAATAYMRRLIDRNLVIEASLDPLYEEELKLNDRIKIVDTNLDINGYFIINDITEDLQNLNKKEIKLDYIGRNLFDFYLPVVNENIIDLEVQIIDQEVQDVIVETGRLKVEIGNKIDFENVVTDLSPTNPLNIPNVSAVNNGLYQTLSTAQDYTDAAVEGAVYNVEYDSQSHEMTFYRHQQPNIVIDLPIEQLISNVELVGDDLVFTFEDGSIVTVPLNALLVDVVKKVNGLTPNSQGEVVLNIADIPGLSSELEKIGTLNSLTTTDKSNLVNAINEVKGSVPTNYITTNTNQTGLTGDKSVDGTWTFNSQINTVNHGNSSQWKQAYDWGDFRSYGLARQYTGSSAQQTSFSNIDSTYVTRQYGVTGSFFGIVNSNRPQGWLIKGATADRWSWMGVTDLGPVRIYATNYTAVDNYVELYHTGNFNPAQYVLQSALNTILDDYATEDWVNQQGFVTSDTTYTGSVSVILSGNSFQRAALTGDVTASQNSNTTTIANNAVTNPKMSPMNANSIKGRVGSIGNPQDLTPAQVRTMLNVQEGANRTRIGINGGNYTEVGDINLIAGSNVSLSKSGDNITINSSSQPIDTTVKVYMPGEVINNDTVNCNASKTIIYLSSTFTGNLNIAIDPDLQDGAELIVIHTLNGGSLFNINGSFINITGQLVSTYQASQGKRYRFIYVKDLERFALVDGGQI